MAEPGKLIERKVYYPGDRIFKEGEDGNRAFLIQEGEVEIFRTSDDKEIVLGCIGKGGIFGEMALIDDKPRMASARAKRQTTVVFVSRKQFGERLSKSDPFIRGLLNILVQNVRSLQDRID